MTLFDEKKKKAILRASPKIAKYFDKSMKTFNSSQKFIQKNDDGSIDFSLEYTQPLEILPFIKKWLPDLKIVAPDELNEVLIADLKSYLS